LIGIQTWIAQNPDRLDRFTTSLACRLLAQHASRARATLRATKPTGFIRFAAE
jgi:hypothetical protein